MPKQFSLYKSSTLFLVACAKLLANARAREYIARTMRKSYFLFTISMTIAAALAFAGDKPNLLSPFPSTVEGIDIPNTHLLANGAGRVLRGMAPWSSLQVMQLREHGITDILIFRNDIPGEPGTAEEIELLTENGIARDRIYQIPFPWKNIREFASPCRQTIQALRLVAAELTRENSGLFFHCTVGEDRTGYLAGLYRILYENYSADKAFREEMCAHGYAEGDFNKPSSVSATVHENITKLFVKMLYLKEMGKLSATRLEESVCEQDPGKLPDFRRRWNESRRKFRCEKQNPPALAK